MALRFASDTAPRTDTDGVAYLSDGTALRLRRARPRDKDRFKRAFARLSPRSRYFRFHGHKRTLSDADLRFLTETDGDLNFALVALEPEAAGGEGELVGVARYTRLSEDSEVAEVAVTVADAYQRRGLGRLLLERLVKEARRRGVARVRVTLLAENAGMRKLIGDQFGDYRLALEDNVYTGEFPIAAADDEIRPSAAPLFELLRLSAAGAVMPLHFALDVSRARLSAVRRRLSDRPEENGPANN